MSLNLLAAALLGCTCAAEPVPEPAPEPAPLDRDANAGKRTKVMPAKPLEDGVAVVMFAHPGFPGTTLWLDGEEKCRIPCKVVTSPGVHAAVLKGEDGAVQFEREVPVIQRRTGVLLLDMSR